MDKHLNLFFGYDQGFYTDNVIDAKSIEQLEDNITRALIVTLKNKY
jgi:hypothetical protein